MAVKDARPSPFTQLATQADWEALIGAMGLPDGVSDVPGGPSLKPGLDTIGRNATMDAGLAVIKGQVWSCDAQQAVSIPAPSGLNRIDRLVLRYDRAAAGSSTVISPVLIAGTPASTPVEPSLSRTPTGAYDIPIGSWVSQSGGGLISLIDERQFAGNAVLIGTSSSRPAPSEPCLLIDTDVPDIVLWNGTAWVQVTKPPLLRAWKTGLLARTSTAMVNDPDLTITLQPNSIYNIRGNLAYDGTASPAGGFAWTFAAPSGWWGGYSAQYNDASSNAQSQWFGWLDTFAWAATTGTGATNYQTVVFNGIIQTGVSGGPFTVQWGRGPTGSGTVNLLGGSMLIAEKM